MKRYLWEFDGRVGNYQLVSDDAVIVDVPDDEEEPGHFLYHWQERRVDTGGHYGGALMVASLEIERIKRLNIPSPLAAKGLLDQLVSAGYVIELAGTPLAPNDRSGA
jgi:hypothetical protein